MRREEGLAQFEEGELVLVLEVLEEREDLLDLVGHEYEPGLWCFVRPVCVGLFVVVIC